MADIQTIKEVIQLCRAAEISLFIWGQHGIGKSSIVKQTADFLGIDFIDFRCAQIDAVDLRGFPDRGSDGRTHFLPPVDLPNDGEGILFLDELNRANREVLSAAFQLVLDRRVGQYQLPRGWSVVCAGNFDSDDYAVTEIDSAFADRFCHVTFDVGPQTSQQWAKWMIGTHGDDAYRVVNFCRTNQAHLEVQNDENQLSFEIQPSRRSWDAVVRGLTCFADAEYSEKCKFSFVAGLVGEELAVSFINHQPTISPGDLIRVGTKRLKPKLRKCERAELSAIGLGLVQLSRAQDDTNDVASVVLDFAEFLLQDHSDLAIALCNDMLSNEADFSDLRYSSALLANTSLADSVHELQTQKSKLLSNLKQRPRLQQKLADVMTKV